MGLCSMGYVRGRRRAVSTAYYLQHLLLSICGEILGNLGVQVLAAMLQDEHDEGDSRHDEQDAEPKGLREGVEQEMGLLIHGARLGFDNNAEACDTELEC